MKTTALPEVQLHPDMREGEGGGGGWAREEKSCLMDNVHDKLSWMAQTSIQSWNFCSASFYAINMQ